MATFLYRAFDRSGNVVAGVMEAADARAVVERLQRDAYFPVHVAPEHASDRLSAFARLRDPALGDWVETEVRFPNSMVDRITPVTTVQAHCRPEIDARSPAAPLAAA